MLGANKSQTFTQKWFDLKWVKISNEKCVGKSKDWRDTAHQLRIHFELALQGGEVENGSHRA